MCKRLIYFVSAVVLSFACTSQALVIGDFEGGLDGWLPAGASTLTPSTTGVTSGAGALLIEGPGSWQMLAKLEAKSLRGSLGVADAAVSIDVTAFAADMVTDWMNMEVIINGQNNDASGANNNIGWQSLGAQNLVRDGAAQTLRWEVPDDLAAKIAGTDDNIQWFELFIVTNNGAPNTKIYIDNIQLLGAEPQPPAGPKIIWVSFHGADDAPSAGAVGNGFTEAPDKGYTDLLKANGYDVTRYIQTGTPDVNVLNAADLVIVSRSVASGSFQNAAATRWNTTVSAPVMLMNGYTTRKSRLGFNVGSNLPDTTGDISLTASDPNHPIFAGIALTNGAMNNLYAGVLNYADGVAARGISVVTDAATPGGTVLATLSAASGTVTAGSMVIAEWPAGASVTHDGGAGTDVLAGPRLVFLTGSREAASGKSSETAGMYDLYEDGAKLFLNAVKYMIPVPDNNLLVNGGFEDGVLEPWATYGNVTTEVVQELVGAVVPDAPIEGKNCLHVVVPAAGANFWDAGLQHPGHVFKAGKKYTLSVWLKSKSGTLTINMKPELAADPWSGFGEQQVTMTDQWAQYSVTTPGFTQDTSPCSATFHIAFAAGEFWVDDARLIEEDYVPPAGGANELTNGNFEEGPTMPLDTWAPGTWNVYGTHTMEVVSELTGAAVPEAPVEGLYCLHVTVPEASANFWDVGLQNAPHTFMQGKKYTLSVWLKSKSGTLTVNMKPELAADPWSGFGEQQVTMTDTWAEYSTTTPEFAQDTSPGSLTFHIGFAAGDFWMDNVRWYEGDYVAP